MVCRVRYLSSAGIHPREIAGIDVLAKAFPSNWLLYTSLQFYPPNEWPLEIDAMVVMADRVLLLELKDWNGTLTHNGDQWLINGKLRGRSPVESIGLKAKKLKSFLGSAIPGFSKFGVDFRVVLTGTANKQGLSTREQSFVWSLAEAATIGTPPGRHLLQSAPLQTKTAYQFESDFERITANPKFFRASEAIWDGYRVTDEDYVVHPRNIWREHKAELARDPLHKALLRVWAFNELPVGLNSPEKRRFVADREIRALGRLSEMGSAIIQRGGILSSIGSDKDEVLTQHFELRTLAPHWTTLDRFVAREGSDLVLEDRIVATTTLLNLLGDLHAHGISHRDLGRRAIWIGSPTRMALNGLMCCQIPGDESISDWASTLRGHSDPAPEDSDASLPGTGMQRDVLDVGRLAHELLYLARPTAPWNIITMPETSDVPDFATWLQKATARAPQDRYSNAREMADAFAALVEQSGRKGADQTLIDAYETTDHPYLLYPMTTSLHNDGRTHIYESQQASGERLVVKVWMGARRNMNVATDLGLIKLFQGVARIAGSPVRGLPNFVRAALSPLGAFVVYRKVDGEPLRPNPGHGLEDLNVEQILDFALQLLLTVDVLHGIGCAHEDIALKNVIRDPTTNTGVLIDLFDLAEVGDGSRFTVSQRPEGWERLTAQQLDRFAVIKLINEFLPAQASQQINDVRAILQTELKRTVIESLEPAILGVRTCLRQLQDPPPPRFILTVPDATPDFFKPDGDVFYLSMGINGLTTTYWIAGLERQMRFRVVGGAVQEVEFEDATFVNLAHASKNGLPVRMIIDVQAGPDSGLEELYAFISSRVSPLPDQDEPDDGLPAEATGRLDVRRYWRKLLELEQSFQPEVEIVGSVSPKPGPSAAYVYERTGMDFDFDVDSIVEVRMSNNRKVGVVNLEQTDSRVLVVDQSDRRLEPGERVKLIDMRARTSFDRRTKAVERILDDEAVIPDLVDYFDPAHSLAATDHGIEVSDDALAPYQLNRGQQDAFRQVVRYGPVGLLQGPPGTGKTHFIAAFVHWLTSTSSAPRVLIASQSHEAVNNVIEAIIDLFKRIGGRRPGLLRLGSKGITERIRPYHTVAIQERFKSRFDGAEKHRLMALGSALGLSRAFIEGAVEIDRQMGSRARRLEMVIAGAKLELEDVQHDQSHLPPNVQSAMFAFMQAGEPHLGRVASPFDPAGELSLAYDSLRQRVPETSASDVRNVRNLIEFGREWSESLGSSHRNFEEFLAKTRQVVTATCVGVGQSKVRVDKKQFDWVIVDEAARCTPGELAVPAQLGRRLLLVGDHRQLLPMIDKRVIRELNAEMPEVPEAELYRSDFERAYLSDYGRANGHTLTEQYRMAPAICSLVSQCFYEPYDVKLETSPNRIPDPIFDTADLGRLSQPVTWVDTSAAVKSDERMAEWNKTSLWNPGEVDATMKVLERLSENPELVDRLEKLQGDTPIGVICMYSAQKERIDRAFSQRPWEARFRKLVRIETVDSYQGKENTIVIVSLVRCNRIKDQGHVRSANRCNVALSRARERLIIVGSQKMWSGLSKTAPMHRVLTVARKMDDAEIVPVNAL